MKHIVSLSGGNSSAVTADRVMSRYGKENTTLWFADTSWEDDDLYRFLDDLEAYWGMTIIRFKEGRTPLEVASDASIIPNQRRAPCTLTLKILPFRKFLASFPKPVTIHLGYDWTEEHRIARPKAEYEAIEGVSIDFPLLWEPYPDLKYGKTIRSWGIEPGKLYEYGFSHNNCGGRCIKQGIKDWLRLRQIMPERFAEVRDWEQVQRAKGGARGDYAIVRDQSNGKVTPLPLTELEERYPEQIPLFAFEGDSVNCFCSY